MASNFSASIKINAVSNLGKVAAGIAKSTKKMRDGFAKLNANIKAATATMGRFAKRAGLAVVGVGFVLGALIKKTANYGDELDKTSIKTGIAVESLQRLRLAAGLGGASAQDMNTGIRILSRGMDEAAQGTQEYKEIFDRLMLSVTDATGNLKEPDAMLLEIADRFRDMDKAGEKMAIAQQLFGRGGSALIPMLEQGSEAIVELGDNIQNVLTKEDTDKAFKFNDSLLVLTTNIQNLTRKALIPALPILQSYFDKINDNLPNFSKWVDENIDFEKVFSKIESILRKIDLKKVFDVSLESTKTVIDDLRTILSGMREVYDFAKSTGSTFERVTGFKAFMQGLGSVAGRIESGGGAELVKPIRDSLDINLRVDKSGNWTVEGEKIPDNINFTMDSGLTIPAY